VTTPEVLLDATRETLRRHAPFDTMADDALAFAVPRMRLAYFAKDHEILAPGSGIAKHLHIVQRGAVGSRVEDPRAEPEPPRGPGDCFPVGALSAGGPPTRIYRALTDTFCYLLPRDDFLELRRRSPEFERFCTHAITETLRQSLAQLSAHYAQRATEQQAIARPLRELVRRAPVACVAGAPLSEALPKMRDEGVRTIVVTGDHGEPVGMFTLVDLLRRVVLPGTPLTTPLRDVMSSPAVMLPADATAHEAMETMAARGVRQVVVVDGTRLVGVANERDLFALTRVSMRQVQEGLGAARSLDALQGCAEDIRGLTHTLLAQGVTAGALTRTIASLNDALARRALELVLARHDAGDAWCWLALGSEGRGEQTFASDQDNALVFAADGDVAARRERLLAFAGDANETFAALGFPLCTGNVMAGNPEYCLTLPEWKERFMGWLTAPTPQALLGVNIVFDFRPLFGAAPLADALRAWLFGYTRDNKAFLRFMARNALESGPALGLIRAFATDEEPEHRGTLDIKVRGTRLFVDAARVFALGFGIAETSTPSRLRTAAGAMRIEARHVEATVEAFNYLQLLRLRVQDDGRPRTHAAANRLDPYVLNELDQRMLKEAFRQARKLQERLAQWCEL
jgi:CBS domain-containing protein